MALPPDKISGPTMTGRSLPPPPSSAVGTPAFNVRVLGLRRSWRRDLYHAARKASWPVIFGVIAGIYVFFNFLFAVIFWLGGDVISNARPGSFADAFYFSVQTMATIGYGGMVPKGPFANLLVVAESLVGLLFSAMATGLIFARFATPMPRVLFSQVATVGVSDGRRVLMLRLANERREHMILEATVRLTLAMDEPEPHGGTRRRLYDLMLERDRSPLFQLSFTVYHPIDAHSPMRGLTPEELARRNAMVIVTFTGIDESVAQSVHARNTYAASAIIFGARFVDILHPNQDGERVIDYRRFHDVVPVELPPG